MKFAPLYELYPPGSYFELECFPKFILIKCMPIPSTKTKTLGPLVCDVPLDSPRALNELFTNLKFKKESIL